MQKKQNLDQNVHVSKMKKDMYIKQNLGQNEHVSISKKILLIQILIILHKSHNPMLMTSGTF